ncbi:hypothetical protein PanWU01x14_102320 [Parasponia andersonii]|uniref:Uncharacterized protein n=1 Tax=Parasponia andersonii TaxID=3476 RepID=A0A2P5D2Y7_PARAD|nr:hypothetical protein PanWU01x14_102320 [Parasponia andersonii]
MAGDGLEIAKLTDMSLTPSLNTQKLPQPSHSVTLSSLRSLQPPAKDAGLKCGPATSSNAAPSAQQRYPVCTRRLSCSVSGTLSSSSHSISVPRLTRTELQLLLKSLSHKELKLSSLSCTLSVALLSSLS